MKVSDILGRILAKDETSRALQISGLIRFSLLVLQGIILVKCGLDPMLIAVVESFYFLYNLSRFYFLSGGKYAGFGKLKEQDYSFSTIFWGFNIIGLAAAVVTVFIIVAGQTDFETFLQLKYATYVLPILVFLSLPVDSYDLFYIRKDKPRSIVIYTLLNSLIQLIGLVYLLTQDFHMGHVVLFFTAFFAFRYVHLLYVSSAGLNLQWSGAWTFALFAAPLILHALFSGLTDYVDGWLIKSFFDDAAFAVYRYGARELPLNTILVSAVVSGLILYKSDIGSTMKQEIKKLLWLLTPILALLILLSPWLFQFFYSADYKMSALYFNLYALLIISHILFVQVFFYRADDRWLLSIISLAEVICNVGLSLVLMRSLGILGIPIATLIVDSLFRIGLIVLVRQRYSQSPGNYYPIKAHVVSSGILLICFWISYVMHF